MTRKTSTPVIDAKVIEAAEQSAAPAQLNALPADVADAIKPLGGEWTLKQLSERQDTLVQTTTDVLLAGGYAVGTVAVAKAVMLATFAFGGGALAATTVVVSVAAVVATAAWIALRYLLDLTAISTWVCNNAVAAYEWIKAKLVAFWNWLCSFFKKDEPAPAPVAA